MNFTDKTFEQLEPFERYFKSATSANWCPNPGRAALGIMADALAEKDGRRPFINFSCGSCILTVVRRAGFLYFADKAEREAATPAEATREAAAAPEAPEPSKTPAKKTTAKKTTKK